MRNLCQSVLPGLLSGWCLLAGCADANHGANDFSDGLPGTTFTRPVAMLEVPGKAGAFVVLEQPGTIQAVTRQGLTCSKRPFAKVAVTGGDSEGDERGLLGMAFHPSYQDNRKYYLFYVNDSANVVAEGFADSTLLKDSGGGLRILLSIPDPFANHNGGTLAFGPKDGFLYIGTGDGGAAGDPFGNGQDRNSLLGKFLRIDVDAQAGGKPYAVPADNPFVRGGGRPEVWAYGLRNPWKGSFDPLTGDLWAADVGQYWLEEVDIIEKGGNYGWSVFEANQCFPDTLSACALEDHKAPLFSYQHDDLGGISVTGGVVYRGDAASPYFGSFIVGDYGSSHVWAVRKDGQATSLPKTPDIGISSFATDASGQVYVMGVKSDLIYRMNNLRGSPASQTNRLMLGGKSR